MRTDVASASSESTHLSLPALVLGGATFLLALAFTVAAFA